MFVHEMLYFHRQNAELKMWFCPCLYRFLSLFMLFKVHTQVYFLWKMMQLDVFSILLGGKKYMSWFCAQMVQQMNNVAWVFFSFISWHTPEVFYASQVQWQRWCFSAQKRIHRLSNGGDQASYPHSKFLYEFRAKSVHAQSQVMRLQVKLLSDFPVYGIYLPPVMRLLVDEQAGANRCA